MSYHDPRVKIIKYEKVDFIVPERIRGARIYREIEFKEAAKMLEIPERELGLIENGHVENISKEFLFKVMKAYGFPKGFFYKVIWERV
jgi:transcriptional regulator with XRE-family HTH domain